MALRAAAAGLVFASFALSGCGEGKLDVWEQMRIVGSTGATAYAQTVSEELLIAQPKLKPPIVEATGSGQGISLFCGAIGGTSPDVVISSRRMKKEEHDACEANGVKDSIEFALGLDALALAQKKDGPAWQLSSTDIYRAFAALPFGRRNRAQKWSEINPALRALPMLLYGPGSTSGTRSGFADLIMTPACKADPAMQAIKDKNAIDRICKQFRSDGRYVLTDENEVFTLYKLKTNRSAIALVSLPFVEKNADTVRAISIDGVLPNDTTIRDGSYAGARRVYAYVKRAHLDAVPGLKDYVAKLQAESGPDALLPKYGLIALPDTDRAESAEIVRTWRSLDTKDLK